MIAAWTRQATQNALEEKANALADQLRNGAEMAGMDLNLVTNRGAMRDGFIEGTPPDFTGTVFDLEENGVAVLAADGDAWLVRLDAITPADHDSPEAAALKDAFTRETTQSLSNAVTNAFTQAIVDEAGVDINSAALNAVHVHMR